MKPDYNFIWLDASEIELYWDDDHIPPTHTADVYAIYDRFSGEYLGDIQITYPAMMPLQQRDFVGLMAKIHPYGHRCHHIAAVHFDLYEAFNHGLIGDDSASIWKFDAMGVSVYVYA